MFFSRYEYLELPSFLCLKVEQNSSLKSTEIFKILSVFLFSEQREWIYQKGKTLFIFYANQLHTGLYQVAARSQYFGESVQRFRIIVVDGKCVQ